MAKLKKIPFKLWFFAFAVILMAVSIVRLPRVGADDTAYNRYSRDNYIGLCSAVVKYHDTMNNIVNDYIEKLLSDEGVIEPPEEDIPLGEVCPDDDNVSTYCLSLRLVQEYDGFMRALNDTQRTALDPEEELDDTLFNSSERLMEKRAQRSDFIDFQVELARQVMDVTLGVYNELQVFYPLHVGYQALIEDLEDYRDALSDVRRQVEQYPGKFVNASTTECT